MSTKITIFLFAVLALTLTGCVQRASTPFPTATLEANFPAVPTTDMNVVEQAGTQTAIALTGTPQGGVAPVDSTQAPVVIATFTPLGGVAQASAGTDTPMPSPTPGVVVANTPVPGVVPATYALKQGEFPWCIARRFNVDPDELLALNGLSRTQDYFIPGTVLKIPSSGKPFPLTRHIIAHPATYTVQTGDTIYSVACKYGDVDPIAIAAANNLPAPYNLTTGAQIAIP
jgi:LysM repeat protein